MHSHRSYRFGEDITPSTFVKRQTGVDHTVVTAGEGDVAVGITFQGTRDAPIPSITDPIAAAEGESAQVYSLGEPCELRNGTAAVQAGDYLKPDANGFAAVAAPGEQYSAAADAGAAPGELVKVTVERGTVPAAA